MESRIRLFIPTQTENELVQRANYLGVSLSSVILLHLVVYDPCVVSREEFIGFKKDECRSIQMDLKKEVIQKFDGQALYSHPFYLYLSIHLTNIVNATRNEWEGKRSAVKQKMKTSTYSIDEEVIKKLDELRKKTKLTVTALVNYAILVKGGSLDLNEDKRKKEVRGLQLSELALIKMNESIADSGLGSGTYIENNVKNLLMLLAKQWHL